jgi:hypothetical protein
LTWLQLTNAVLALAGDGAKLLAHSERPWHSITFSGTHHVFVLDFQGREAVEIGEAFLSIITEQDFALSGHVVADVSVNWVNGTARPDSLTTEIAILLVEHAPAVAA